MTEQEQVQDPYTIYVNVKIVDLWCDTYTETLKGNIVNTNQFSVVENAIVFPIQCAAKEIADKAVADFKIFLKGE